MRSLNRHIPKFDRIKDGVLHAFSLQSSYHYDALWPVVWEYYKQHSARKVSPPIDQDRGRLRMYEKLQELVQDKKVRREGKLYTWI